MQKTPERFIAKFLVFAGEQNKFMPRNVDGLRWHRDHPVSADIAYVEIFAHAFDDTVRLLPTQVRVFFNELVRSLIEPALCAGLMPMPSFVMIALVAAGTLN